MTPASAAPPPDLAQHFERIITDRHVRAGRTLVAALGLVPGASVLELGCGTGLLSEHLADKVGMRGDVLGLDPSAYHMAIAHQRSRPNLRFQVGSPFAMARFPAACFDVVVANGLLQHWPDHLTPLRELHRVLKPGGRLGLVTDSRDHPHPVSVVHDAVVARAPFSDYGRSPDDVSHAVTATELDALLHQAGFDQVEITPQADVNVHSTVSAAIAFVQAGAWGRFLRHLPDKPLDLRDQALQQITLGLERLRTAEGIRHTGLRLMAVARK